jgi:predicted nucleotidyltransferase
MDGIEEQLRGVIAAQPYPLVFVTVSGAHLYGFPSPDSDWDVRGVHVLPASALLGLESGPETIEALGAERGLDLDLVTHDARKFFRLMLNRNGYVLEQLLSPLVLHTTPEHDELKALAPLCITRRHAYHYLGFARTQWRLFEKEPRVKPLLYVYRVLLTGIHLMRSGEVEANLPRLNAALRLPQVDALIARKLAGPEKAALSDPEVEFHRDEYERLTGALHEAHAGSVLPEEPSARSDLHNLLLRLRGADICDGVI